VHLYVQTELECACIYYLSYTSSIMDETQIHIIYYRGGCWYVNKIRSLSVGGLIHNTMVQYMFSAAGRGGGTT
jgi:hypothetical protein